MKKLTTITILIMGIFFTGLLGQAMYIGDANNYFGLSGSYESESQPDGSTTTL